MAENNEHRILDSKAMIYTNKFGVWQFRLWLADENKYVRKSLKTKEKSRAIALGGDMYMKIYVERQSGIKQHSITIKEGVQQYIDYRGKEVGFGTENITKGSHRHSLY